MYSMLDGDALMTVEHLDFAEFEIDGGDHLISKNSKPDIPRQRSD